MSRLLILILLSCASIAHAGRCRSVSLRPEDWSALMAVTKKTVDRQIDTKTIQVCRTSQHIFAFMFTVREKQPDGSMRWESIDCSRGGEQSVGWTCKRYPERSVRLASGSRVPAKVVELPLWMNAQDAEPLVTMAYDSLATMSESNLCKNRGRRAPAVEAMRESFLSRDEGVLFLNGESGSELFLYRSDYFIGFTPDQDRDSAWKVHCWGQQEEILE